MKRLFLVASTALAAGGCAATPEDRPATVSAAPPAVVAPAPVPSVAVRDAQQKLRTLGYYDGPADGVPGAATSRAIEAFQRDRGLAVDGQLGPVTADALRDARVPTASAAAPRPAPARVAALPVTDPTAVRAVQNRLRQLGFYDGAADGVWGVGTQSAVEQFQRSKGLNVSGEITPQTASAMGLDPASFAPGRLANVAEPLNPAVVKRIQTKLRQAGFYSGAVDGVWGARSEEAVERFQRARGFEPSGQLTPPTIAALGLDPNNLAESAGSSGPRAR
jgi:peptidoglycan hydrolase-like protein with peptidoglycan-binding domain